MIEFYSEIHIILKIERIYEGGEQKKDTKLKWNACVYKFTDIILCDR